MIKQKWQLISNFTDIPEVLFFDILNFCLKENRYFKYDDKIYEQLKGMPMGSPASPVIADIVMEELIESTIQNLEQKPRLMSKYVDDLFCIIRKDATDITLKTLNSFHRNIQFTRELEKDGKLPFLDTIVIRQKNKLTLNWYQKPIASGRLINFYSNHPKHVKFNTAQNFAKRVLQISDKVYHKENIEKIRTILQKNSFSPETTTRLIKNAIKDMEKTTTDYPEKIYKSMTHVPGFSERIVHSDIYDSSYFNIALKTDNTLNTLFSKTKSRIDALDKFNVIYTIPCNGDGSNICEKIYVGTTKSKLRTRLSAHKSDHRIGKGTTEQKTALAAHCAINGHSPNINNAAILQKEDNYKKRFTIEMLHIINTPTEKRINYKTDTENCAHSYRHIITKYQHKQKRKTKIC